MSRDDLERRVVALYRLLVVVQVVKTHSFVIPCMYVTRIDLEGLIIALYRLGVAA